MLARDCQSFFITYETPAAFCNAVDNVRDIRQQAQEDKITYCERINDAKNRCGNDIDGVDKMKSFSIKIFPSTQTMVVRYRESKHQRYFSY